MKYTFEPLDIYNNPSNVSGVLSYTLKLIFVNWLVRVHRKYNNMVFCLSISEKSLFRTVYFTFLCVFFFISIFIRCHVCILVVFMTVLISPSKTDNLADH